MEGLADYIIIKKHCMHAKETK